jgi:hypothetical protein
MHCNKVLTYDIHAIQQKDVLHEVNQFNEIQYKIIDELLKSRKFGGGFLLTPGKSFPQNLFENILNKQFYIFGN